MRSVRRRTLAGPRIAAIATIAASTALIAGCSGAGDTGGPVETTPPERTMTTVALSEDEFREEAADVCQDFDEQREDLGTPPSDADDLAIFLEDVAELQADGAQELGELEPPEELADDFADAVEALEERAEFAEDLADRVAEGESLTDVLDDLGGDIEDRQADANEAFENLDVAECVSEDSGPDGPTTDDGPPPPPPPPSDLTEAEQALVRDLDPPGQTCVSDQVLRGSVAAIECRGGRIVQFYDRFPNREVLRTAYRAILQNGTSLGEESNVGSCPTELPSEGAWFFGQENQPRGRIACYRDRDNGRPRLIWTIDRRGVLGQAVGPNPRALHNWWAQRGPN